MSHKELLMSETIIQQYIGFLNTNMSMIAKGKYSGTSREGKTFYQVCVCDVCVSRYRAYDNH